MMQVDMIGGRRVQRRYSRTDPETIENMVEYALRIAGSLTRLVIETSRANLPYLLTPSLVDPKLVYPTEFDSLL